MAIQPFMGLRPERWAGTGAGRGAHIVVAGAHIAAEIHADFKPTGPMPRFSLGLPVTGKPSIYKSGGWKNDADTQAMGGIGG